MCVVWLGLLFSDINEKCFWFDCSSVLDQGAIVVSRLHVVTHGLYVVWFEMMYLLELWVNFVWFVHLWRCTGGVLFSFCLSVLVHGASVSERQNIASF